MTAVRTLQEGMKLTHPTGAVADNNGGDWPDDQFTARRLMDKDIELVKADAPPPPPPPPSGEGSQEDTQQKKDKR